MQLLKEKPFKEYCEKLKEYTKDGNKLEPFYSFDLQSDLVLYIPNSDILFLKEYLSQDKSVRIVAYNVEFGIWSYSTKINENEINNFDLQKLLLESFTTNIHFMIEKIKYAITTKNYDSIFANGESFKPTLRGVNTNIQQEIELKNFKDKVEQLFSPDEENKSVLSNICKTILIEWNSSFKKNIESAEV